MSSTVEKLSATQAKLTVEIPFAELKPYLDRTYKEIAEQVTVPGFRKGKVPATVIDQRFGRGVVLQEAINEALPEAYAKAISEAGLTPMGQPEIDVTKLEDNELVEFTAEVEVRPEIELPDFAAITAEVDALETSDEAVDERIELLRQRFATTTEVDRAAKDGDVVTIDLSATQDGVELEDGQATGVTYQLGDASKTMLDGLDEALQGMKAGESKVFTSTLVGGAHRDQEADIKVSVTQVAEQELPEVDDEFAQLISEFDTVEEMREDLKAAVEAQAKEDQQEQARDKVIEAILAQLDFEVPAKALNADVEARRKQIEQQFAQQGRTVEDYISAAEDEEAETADEFWTSIAKRSTDAFRAQMLLDVYAEENTVEVSQQDLTELIFRRAQETGRSPQEEINHMMEHNHMQEWMQEVRRNKALIAICAQATVTDTDGNPVEMPQLETEAAEEEAAEEEAAEGEAADES